MRSLVNHRPEGDKLLSTLLLRGALAIVFFLVLLAIDANGQAPLANPHVQVRHILGFGNVSRNHTGELSIDQNDLHFQPQGSRSASVTLSSIQNISLGEQDKQIGGVPMMLGKAAVPFGGGRVVSLFSHKKYDTLAIEYQDSKGGFHGALFLLPKGLGEAFKNALIAHGAHIGPSEALVVAQGAPKESGGNGKWNLLVDRIDPGATTLDPCFTDAIYENLVRQLKKSKQFNDVFRSGDRDANSTSGLLVLKTVVEEYSAGSETKRAVTTVGGATKLKAHVQLLMPDGKFLYERVVTGNVRLMGDNLSATTKLANNTAKALNQSNLPSRSAPTLAKATSKDAAGGL